jgi:hypothetical protein
MSLYLGRGRDSRRGICSFAINSLGYLPDWEAGLLQVSFRRAISCATLLRWGPMRAKFLYPNRFRGFGFGWRNALDTLALPSAVPGPSAG